MSPEPSQDPVDDKLNTSNINVGVITAHESDSEDEDSNNLGYMPLSQIPVEGESLEEDNDDDEEFEWDSVPAEPVSNNVEESSIDPETLEVWSSQCNTSNIDLDPDKINQVKSAMASFTLPSTAIPEWANSISEDQWKERLIDRIKEIQKNK